MEFHKKLKCTINIKVIPQTINEHNIIKFQAWADSHVNFQYHERAPLMKIGPKTESSFPDYDGLVAVSQNLTGPRPKLHKGRKIPETTNPY